MKNRKSTYYKQKQKTKDTITHLYHKNHGILGYRQMKIFLEREGICISNTTCHKYMNTELKLYSITRRKKTGSCRGSHHEVFDNLINRDFAYVWYNHVRPHSYNDGLTPAQKRKNYSSVYAAKAA